MKETKEINALLNLLDDPDTQVFEAVSKTLLHYGKKVVPNLENYWEQTHDPAIQTRIEELIHKVNYTELQVQFKNWAETPNNKLLEGMIIITQFQFANVDEVAIRKKLKSIYQSTWIELNSYLTPIEQVNIVSSILYNMYKLKTHPVEPSKINYFYLNFLLESHKGNPYSMGALYVILCEMLDIPIFTVNIPNQFVLAYFDDVYDFMRPTAPAKNKILFYIDPINGMIYTQEDVDVYLKKIKDENNKDYNKALTANGAMKVYLQNLQTAYKLQNNDACKEKELQVLIDLL